MTKATKARPKGPILLLCALLAAFFLLQLTRIDQAPWENYDSWRRAADTYTIAQLRRPQHEPPAPSIQLRRPGEEATVQLELQIMPYLSALAFRLLGSQPYWVPRLISLLFFMGSALFVFGIGRRLFRGDMPACGLPASTWPCPSACCMPGPSCLRPRPCFSTPARSISFCAGTSRTLCPTCCSPP